MKKSNICISVLILFFSQNAFSQIDTTDWYPLHIGDKWEYYGQGFGYSQVEVIGDTLMPNGKTYFTLTSYDREYQRVEKNRYVMVYNESTIDIDNEYLNFDLLAKKGDVFIPQRPNIPGYGVYCEGVNNDNFLNVNLSWKEYRLVYIDSTIFPPDTIWIEAVDTYWPRITKGIGVSSYAYGLTHLVGAVINGVGYGTLVGVENDLNKNTPNNFNIYQNYPNPFNPTTQISYQLPENSFVNLVVYNTIGQKVAELVNQEQKSGKYTVKFDASNLPSGVYIYKLQAGEFSDAKKMLITK